MKRLWAACLMVIGLNTLLLVLPGLFGLTLPDAVVLAVGAVDLVATPLLIYASLKVYLKK